MSRRLPGENESEYALWNFGAAPLAVGNRRVLVIHKDHAVGESIVMLLKLKNLDAIYKPAPAQARSTIKSRRPAVILLDTRTDDADYSFAKAFGHRMSRPDLLLIAMSNFAPRESVETLRQAGFDGHFRRPCETWRIIDVLVSFFQPDDGSQAARSRPPRRD